MGKRPFVKVDAEEPEAEKTSTGIEALAEALRKISAAMERIDNAGITQACIVTLLHDQTKISKKMIVRILDGLGALEKTYLTPKKGRP